MKKNYKILSIFIHKNLEKFSNFVLSVNVTHKKKLQKINKNQIKTNS